MDKQTRNITLVSKEYMVMKNSELLFAVEHFSFFQLYAILAWQKN
jgi:hypothetical protein